ncbi:MAG: leucine--tRNA ligase [Thermoplasmata archaeon]|nr:MAG: leucine--tRNA ligase [Thermoplasmata archaeon]
MDFASIEKKWQERWFSREIYKAKKEKGRKFFIHFAYPGISGYLHVGHMRGFTYADIIARYMRMKGYDVIFPAGFHATGLPAVSLAKKVARKDEATLQYLRQNGCPEEIIERLADPLEVVKFFSKVYVEEYWKKFGFLIDYTRLMDTISPGYKKFIQWQFRKLNEKGLLIQKPHFAPFCPNCGPVAVDRSETDISEGGDAEILEFIVIKFKYNGKILPAATLRPETIFGVTNMWVNDEVEYIIAKIGNEEWILSEKAVKKLKYQLDEVEVIGKIHGKELVGKKCIAPIINKEIPILPAKFVSPDIATGIVMSVPAHAPYDYVALRDLGMPVEPIVIIKIQGYEIPAKEIVEKMGIKNQTEYEKLEEATEIIYKEEFHKGIMNENCKEYEGMKVNEAKEEIKNDLLLTNQAIIMREFSKRVVCRCGEEVVIKKIPDQWFIKYSDEELTEKSKEWVKNMNIYPKDYKEELPKILEWYGDRACIRQGSWLGTPFPFDEKWVIEPISDSTLYPAYYIISKYVNEGKINVEEMNDDFFDYVFLGKGEAKNEIWEEIRKEFDYWYPVDINLGGKEHKTVHFPVFIMNHVAIMPQKYWPKGIFVNWWITQKAGAKISKSKGGAEPIPDAVERYGVDAMRLYYAHIGSPFVDIEWDAEAVENYKKRIIKLWELFEKLIGLEGEVKKIDEWLKNAFNEKLKEANEAMKEFELRKAANALFFEMFNAFEWYLKRGGENKELIRKILEKWIRAITPFTPHIAEEMWEKLGNKGFVSLESYPMEEEIDYEVLKAEEVLKETIDDMQEIIKVTKIKPNKIYLYFAPSWKWELAEIAYKLHKEGNLNMKNLMQEAKKLNVDMKEASQYASKLLQEIRKEEFVKINEKEYFESAKEFLEKEFNAEFIFDADYDPKGKKKYAMPYKPAIYME